VQGANRPGHNKKSVGPDRIWGAAACGQGSCVKAGMSPFPEAKGTPQSKRLALRRIDTKQGGKKRAGSVR